VEGRDLTLGTQWKQQEPGIDRMVSNPIYGSALRKALYELAKGASEDAPVC